MLLVLGLIIGLAAAYMLLKNKNDEPSEDELRVQKIRDLLNAEPDPLVNTIKNARHQRIDDEIDWYNIRRVAGQYELERTWNLPSVMALGYDRWQLSRHYPGFQSLYYKSGY
jgi:hypothetical protein